MNTVETVTQIARKGALAYVGALALTGDAARESFERLAKRGTEARQRAQGELKRAARTLRREAKEVAAEGQEQIAETRSLLVQGRDRLFDTLKLPTQETFQELRGQVERLSAALDDLRVKSRRQLAEPIPGYEKMNVDTVLGQLPRLDEPALLAVRVYEEANQNRVTVLRGIERTLAERQAAPVAA